MAYDWNPADLTGGHMDADWTNSLIMGNPPDVTGQPATILTSSAPLTQAKGGVYLSDFATFANTFGARAVICFNSFTDTNPGSANLMAQAAKSAGLNVVEWGTFKRGGALSADLSIGGRLRSGGVQPVFHRYCRRSRAL